ncbi:MAG: PAS domain S-box protein, partial [Bacteroidales bacterium]|nr:PAS domain S-box protein [Bacteroidales bacterium]
IKNILKTRKPCITEHIHYDKNGIAKYIEIRGYPIFNKENQITQIIEHAIDITEKKQNSEIIQKEKKQTQAYLDIAAVMLVVLDTNQKVVLCNKEGLKILGYTENELIGKNWFDIVIPENERIVVKEVFDAFVAEKIDAPEYFENYILTKTGEKKLIAWKNSFIRNEAGKIEKLISSGEEITWKRQSEEKLKVSEQKYYDLFENHSAPKLIVEMETGRIIDCNQAATEFYGWSKNELKRMNIRQINLLSPEEFKNIMNVINTKKQKYFEFKHRCANGSIKDVEVYVGKVIIDGRKCIHAVIHDITSRKISERLLAQNHKLDASLAKLFVPLIKDNISINEIAHSVYNEALALTNSSICYIAIIDQEYPDNLIAYTSTDMLKKEDSTVTQQEMSKTVFSRAIDGKFPVLFGYSLNKKESFFTNKASELLESTGVPEGHKKIDKFLSVPVLLNQELVGQIALANPENDYTQEDLKTIEHLAEYMSLAIQRHRASEKIKSSEKRFKTVAENSGEWIWEVDAKGLFTYSSHVVKEINGYTADEIVGKKHYFDFYAKELHQTKMQEAAELFKAMKSFSGIEDKIMHKDGREISIETKGIPIIDESGQLKGYMGSTINITEKKQAEADLIKHAKELELFNNAMVDREMRIIEMKEEVNALCRSLNIELRYPESWK